MIVFVLGFGIQSLYLFILVYYKTIIITGVRDPLIIKDALALGVDRAVFLETDGREWDPRATAQAIAKAIKLQGEQGFELDVLLFGNEAADSGNYQVGVRVAHILDVPCVSGVKGLELKDNMALAKRETDDGWEIFEVSLPAVFTVKEGINLPRYPSLPGRLKAKKKPIEQVEPQESAGGLAKVRLRTLPTQVSDVDILGTGPDTATKVIIILKELRLL